MARENRIDHEPAYVLHSWPYRETSLLVEILTRHYGRLVVVARGARRPKSELRGTLLAFQPLNLSWFGKGDVKTLHAAEWEGGLPQLSGQPLLCGFYLNELLLRLLHRDDPHEVIFDAYATTLIHLAHGSDLGNTLRRFELQLLAQLGYGIRLNEDINNQAIQPESYYRYINDQGPVLANKGQGGLILGQTLLDCAQEDFSNPITKAQSRQLLRQVLQQHLGTEPLQSRLLLQDWPDA